ncbi:hypothetical protein D1818_20820 [Aquimarina sp. BL5]|uniref:hypothetical protein n=1 Tax=Aquimarina sp. BL5 TaxID=1714860 RepID=UPI000E4CC028|nr:hypothetical protein [Aquimarina sp. BL5]AXT53149.1 hypothetical protein D1818_20820 [Aquimarina sp. BL5]RKN04816.1 hypothetical protein D7036_11590 [Aquimarina sp. BL5]
MIVNSILLEVGNLDGLIYLILLVLLGPPIFLALIGLILFRTKNRKAGKVFFILAGVYLVVGLGICGALISQN